MADPISVTGKWVLPDGRVVTEQPVEGRLLVSPGGPMTPDVKQAIEAAEAAAPPPVDEPADVNDEKADEEAEPGPTPRKRASKT